MSNTLRKITVRAVYGRIHPSKVFGMAPDDYREKVENGEWDPVDHRVELMRIWGRVSSYKIEQSNYGEYCRFSGRFEAMATATGELYKSGRMILPPVVEHEVQVAVDDLSQDSSTSWVEFGIAVSVQPDTNNIGYVYHVETLKEPVSETDSLADLRSQIAG